MSSSTMDKVSYVGNADVNAIDHLYKLYRENPESVDIGWQKFFEGFEFAQTDYDKDGAIPENVHREFKVLNLINGYRTRGHLFTKTNPVRERRKYSPTLAIENFGLEEKDLDTVFESGDEVGIGRPATLREIIADLEETYCQSIGIEYTYMRDPERLQWFRNQIELKNRPKYSSDEKIEIFKKLNQAAAFESFLGKKFVGQKRFSIEGGESLIPALDSLITKGADLGVEYFVMGMAHRGRLNTLTNIFEKPVHDILSEFQGKEFDSEDFDGDVKYHQGFTSHITTRNGKKVGLTLSPNPSHLEAVDPVVQGIARAKIDHFHKDESKVCPVMIHGDAAVAGQGIVYEIIQMAQLDGYRAGGTVHIVVNNQVGFTTNYLDGRSSTYCTDVAKTTLCPVFHVNGDDVEAVVQTIQMAIEYRQKFKRDIFIDLLCYRKYGHNEGDEPKFTQPYLYNLIAKHPNPKKIYQDHLVSQGVMTVELAKKLETEYNNHLETEFEISRKAEKAFVWDFLKTTWKGFRRSTAADFDNSPETGVKKEVLLDLGKKLATLPEGKKYFRKISKIFEDRYNAITEDKLDWGSAEMLAYATILAENKPVRVSGQDVERGTFSHRHAVVKAEDTEEEIVTLQNLKEKQGKFSIYNSLLSEYAVLGFEYGYSLATPKGLTIWEAQFGDFFNGAQIMIDQFITSGEDKWSTQSGLTMLLPHGYEGQGAEHSSGRMERFLQQCADYNIQVVNTSTPANHFHLLRRQVSREFCKPLVVFSPKMLLRYPSAVSTLDEMAKGSFQEVIDDPKANATNVDTVVFCSGKFYYEMSEKAAAMGVDNMAFVRVEQLYPLPKNHIDSILKKYKGAKNIIWAQEEPNNMGAWRYIAMAMREIPFVGITRPATAAAAEGSKELHEKRLKALFDQIFQYAKVKVK